MRTMAKVFTDYKVNVFILPALLSALFFTGVPVGCGGGSGGSTVTKTTPTITWATPAAVPIGTVLSATQLDAIASVAGTFVYSPAAGDVLSTAGSIPLSVTFTPADTTDYTTATDSVSIKVNATSAQPSYSWSNVKVVAGGYVPGLYFHPTQKGLMYARTDVGGAYRWGPNDTQWVPLLDWTSRADWWQIGVEAIGMDPNNANNLYIAVGMYASPTTTTWDGKGAMLVSTDQGSTFTTVPLTFQNGSNDNGRNTGERIAVDPNLSSTIYFGTRVAGLQISTNSGAAWSKSTGLPVTTTAINSGVISVLPVQSSGSSGSATPVVYAAVSGTGSGSDPQGLYVTANGGSTTSTWTAVTGQPSLSGKSLGVSCSGSTANLAPLQAKLGPNGHVYILYGDQAGPGSMNCNQLWEFTPASGWTSGTWSQITLPNGSGTINNTDGYGGIAVDPSNAGVLLLSTLDQYWPTGDVVYRSNDDGVTWRDVSSIKLYNSPSSTSPDLATHDDSLSPWLAFGVTTPTEANGTPLSVSTGNWATAMAIDPFNSAHAIYGTGQTIWATTDLTNADPSASSVGVVDWTVGANGVEETVVEGLWAPPSGKTILLSSMGDIFGFAHQNLTISPSQQMYTNPTATPTSIDFEQNTPTTVVRVTDGTYGASPIGVLSTDAGITWTGFGTDPTGTKGGGTIAIAPDGSSIVWATEDTSSVWYSTNSGATWTASTGIPAQAQVVSDRIKAGVYYGFSGSTLYLSTNSGATWTSQQSGLPSSSVLVSLPDAQGDLWLSGSTSGLYSNTGTASAPTLTANSAVQYAYHLGFGMAATGTTKPALYLDGQVSGTPGVFRSIDGGSTWVQINNTAHQWGQINAICGDMRTFGTVYIGGGARGILWGTSTN